MFENSRYKTDGFQLIIHIPTFCKINVLLRIYEQI